MDLHDEYGEKPPFDHLFTNEGGTCGNVVHCSALEWRTAGDSLALFGGFMEIEDYGAAVCALCTNLKRTLNLHSIYCLPPEAKHLTPSKGFGCLDSVWMIFIWPQVTIQGRKIILTDVAFSQSSVWKNYGRLRVTYTCKDVLTRASLVHLI